MVNVLAHAGLGVMLARSAGITERKKVFFFGLMATLPDFDFFSQIILAIIEPELLLDGVTYRRLFYLFFHREFTHSLVFMAIVTVIFHIWKKDRLFTEVLFSGLLSHFLLDYLTTWKLRPLYPFSTASSTLGALYFFDPVVNILALIPVFYYFTDKDYNSKFFERFMGNTRTWIRKNGNHSCRVMLVALIVYCLAMSVAKYATILYINSNNDMDIKYTLSYPFSPGRFITAVEENETHYLVVEYSYFGIKRTESVKIITVYNVSSSSIMQNISTYVNRSIDIYCAYPREEIDFLIFNITEINGSVSVEINDARVALAKHYSYFGSTYRFIFKEGSFDEFFAYYRHSIPPIRQEEELPRHRFDLSCWD